MAQIIARIGDEIFIEGFYSAGDKKQILLYRVIWENSGQTPTIELKEEFHKI